MSHPNQPSEFPVLAKDFPQYAGCNSTATAAILKAMNVESFNQEDFEIALKVVEIQKKKGCSFGEALNEALAFFTQDDAGTSGQSEEERFNQAVAMAANATEFVEQKELHESASEEGYRLAVIRRVLVLKYSILHGGTAAVYNDPEVKKTRELVNQVRVGAASQGEIVNRGFFEQLVAVPQSIGALAPSEEKRLLNGSKS